ncbi:MAG: hypothetical protein ACJZ72_00870 [Opitutales bacterium]
MKSFIPFFLFSMSVFAQSTTPAVPYSGKVAIDGINYHGHATISLFPFRMESERYGALAERSADDECQLYRCSCGRVATRYSTGRAGNECASARRCFSSQDELYLTVHSGHSSTAAGCVPSVPTSRISATPRTPWRRSGPRWRAWRQGVSPGAITRAMLSAEVLADLNNTSGSGSESNATYSPHARLDCSFDARLGCAV